MLDTPQLRQLSAIDQEAIRTVIEGLIDAWHRGDAVAFAAAFTDNADFYNALPTSSRAAQRSSGITPSSSPAFTGAPASATSKSR